MQETVRRGYAPKSALASTTSSDASNIPPAARAPKRDGRSLWLGSCIDSCQRAYTVRSTDKHPRNSSAKVCFFSSGV